jgi:hypothetical protein
MTDLQKPKITYPRCAFCSAFREKDVTHINIGTKPEIKALLDSSGIPSPCLRLRPDCMKTPRYR